MTALFRLNGTVRRDPGIEDWMRRHQGPLGSIAAQWFEVMRACGPDVREVLHDGQPTACVGDAAFAYVDAFAAHVNVGFFRGAELRDPAGLLEGSGRMMRHVKLRRDRPVERAAVRALIEDAYADMVARVRAEVPAPPRDPRTAR